MPVVDAKSTWRCTFCLQPEGQKHLESCVQHGGHQCTVGPGQCNEQPGNSGKERNAFAELARLRKALALADLLQACGINAEMAKDASEDDWNTAAAQAQVRPPSVETQVLVVKLLEDRERLLKRFGVRLVSERETEVTK